MAALHENRANWGRDTKRLHRHNLIYYMQSEPKLQKNIHIIFPIYNLSHCCLVFFDSMCVCLSHTETRTRLSVYASIPFSLFFRCCCITQLASLILFSSCSRQPTIKYCFRQFFEEEVPLNPTMSFSQIHNCQNGSNISCSVSYMIQRQHRNKKYPSIIRGLFINYIQARTHNIKYIIIYFELPFPTANVSLLASYFSLLQFQQRMATIYLRAYKLPYAFSLSVKIGTAAVAVIFCKVGDAYNVKQQHKHQHHLWAPSPSNWR